jgi:hypothetical protein
MRRFNPILFALLLLLLAISCTKDIELTFPEVPLEIVVDGSIETGQPPIIFLTRTQSFNQSLDPSTLQGLFVNDAVVKVSNGQDTVQLKEFCASDLDGPELAQAAELLGISKQDLQAINYCVYTDTTFTMLGQEGTPYILDISTIEGNTLHAETEIPVAVPLDSLWFEYWANSDSLGFIYAELSDPAGERNAYRWWAQRTNTYPGTNIQKDQDYVAPLGSVFEDTFFDGLSFEFFYNRGTVVNSNKEDDNNEEAGFFKLNDFVSVKFATTTLEVEDYIATSDDQLVNNGSPFAVPANLPTNVEGGRGLWAGYAPLFYEVICVP